METSKNREQFVVRVEWTDALDELTNEEMGIMFRNFISYAKGQELDFSSRIVRSNWKQIQPNIDRMNAKYDKDVENGKLGGAPKGTIPWNKGKKKDAQSDANPPQTPKEPLTKGERTYKYNEKEKEKPKDNNMSSDNIMGNFFSSQKTEKNKASFIYDNLDEQSRRNADLEAELILNQKFSMK